MSNLFYLCQNKVTEMISYCSQGNESCKKFILLRNVNNAHNYTNGNQTEQKRRGFFTNKRILTIYLQQTQTSGEVFKNYPLANGNDVNFNSFFCGKRSDQII